MRSPFRIISLTALMVFLSGSLVISSGAAKKEAETGEFCKPGSCESCHLDKVPTREKHDLRPCPVFHAPKTKSGAVKVPAGGGPGVIILDKLTDVYGPARFTHKDHYEMAMMSQDSCWTCHHNSSADKPFPACGKCHKKKQSREDLNKPNLKAAYHQQCLECHKSWSHGTECSACHAKKGAGTVTMKKGLPNNYKSPALPGKKVYETTKYNNSKVTFFHSNHVDMFKLECRQCHNDQKCVDCHDMKKPANKPALKADHKSCFPCHGKDSCETCHRQKESSGFSHAGFPLTGKHAGLKCNKCHPAGKAYAKLDKSCRSCHTDSSMRKFNHGVEAGFTLKAYHKNLACSKCHPSKKAITRVSSDCSTCHKKKWGANFKHSVTGVKLGEIHSTADCKDCHVKGDYGKKPDCNSGGCHDRRMSFPKDKPSN